MKKICFNILVLFFTLSTALYSQSDKNNANIWYFGDRAGIDFNSGTSVALIDGQIDTQEGIATICDNQGEFLFYTDGNTVWDRNHNPMPNGNNSLNGHYSATQTAIIVPNLSDTNLYYIFTVDAAENDLLNGLCYSVIDMTLPGNGTITNPLGDVKPTEMNIQLVTPVAEKVTAVLNPNQIDYWVIAHGWNNNTFYAYEVTSSGVNTIPIISNVGNIHSGGIDNNNAVGYMKSSPNHNKIALVNRTNGTIDLYDFDSSTGTISNEICITPNNPLIYGVEFSKYGEYLFIGGTQIISRYNVSSGTLENITFDNPGYLYPDNVIRALQLGPDGKIYVSIRYYDYLSVISNPEDTNTVLTINGVYLDVDGQGRNCRFGLPNIFYYKGWYNPVSISNIESLNEQIVHIYPNPFNNVTTFVISGKNKKEQYNFILYDLIGKEVKEIKNISTNIFHLKRDNLTSGMYFYKLLNKKEIIAVGKIIVN